MKLNEPRNAEEIYHLREQLRTLMDKQRLSPSELAAKAIIPLSSLTRILNGTIKNPGLDVSISLAKALDVTISELVGDTKINKDQTTLYIEANEGKELLRHISAVIHAYNYEIHIATLIPSGVEPITQHVAHVEGLAMEPIAQLVAQIEGSNRTIQKLIEQLKAVPSVRSVWIHHGFTSDPFFLNH